MKNLGYEKTEDGVTAWRNNGGIIERKALYAGQKKWETVAVPPDFDLRKFCSESGAKYLPKMANHPNRNRVIGSIELDTPDKRRADITLIKGRLICDGNDITQGTKIRLNRKEAIEQVRAMYEGEYWGLKLK